MYKIKNEVLKDYIENDEAKSAKVGTEILISVEDVDIIIERILNPNDKCLCGEGDACSHCPNHSEDI